MAHLNQCLLLNAKKTQQKNSSFLFDLHQSMVINEHQYVTIMAFNASMGGFTTTTKGYFAIQISSQTTKKEVSENPLLRTIIPRKLLSFCDTITFTPVQSQVLHNSRTRYNRKTFPIITASIHCLRLTLHRKLFATKPSPQQLSKSTQKSIENRYNI
jgi:hypothetical protein